MKVLFLDFDGVLNSMVSFFYEGEKKKRDPDNYVRPVNEHLCNICTSNLILMLRKHPDVKIVLSTAWRNLFSIEFLKVKLAEYHINPDLVIGKTPSLRHMPRGGEIAYWLGEHPEVKEFAIVDDNTIVGSSYDYYGQDDKSLNYLKKHFVQTDEVDGLTYRKAMEISDIFTKGPKKRVPRTPKRNA